MEKAKIERINYLAKLSRTRELSEEEKNEQTALRNEYREEFRRGLRGELDNIYIVDKNGEKKKLTQDKGAAADEEK